MSDSIAIIQLDKAKWIDIYTVSGIAVGTVLEIQALNAGDVRLHIDSLLMFYIILGGVAYLRFIYVVLWALWGRTSLTLVEVYFITISFMIALLCLSFIFAKRLKYNLMPLLSIVAGTIVIYIATFYG